MTCSTPPQGRLVEDVPYGSETILLIGEPPEGCAFFHDALSRCDYQIVEAANIQHAEVLLGCLGSGPDLILACTALDLSDALAAWCSQHKTLPLLVIDPEDYRTRPDLCHADLALRIRLALEAARPSRTILIVDENEVERRFLAKLLGTAGYRVSEASSAREASKLLARNRPEILLTEIVMEEVDGLQLIDDVRKRYPNIAAVAMSGVSRADHYLHVARLLGARGVLEKPLLIDEVFRLLRGVKCSPMNEEALTSF